MPKNLKYESIKFQLIREIKRLLDVENFSEFASTQIIESLDFCLHNKTLFVLIGKGDSKNKLDFDVSSIRLYRRALSDSDFEQISIENKKIVNVISSRIIHEVLVDWSRDGQTKS